MIRLSCLLGVFAVTFGAIIPSQRNLIIQKLIVGCKATGIAEVPYQISLHIDTDFICGGSIITATHILTAAHCVLNNEGTKYSIRAGSSQEISGGVVIPVKRITPHPKFSVETVDYDIAVVELSHPLTFSRSISPIKIGNTEPADRELVQASGWGCIEENGVRPIFLQSVIVPMVNRNTCKNNYKDFINVTPRMICAGTEGKDTCQGDSGGPLVYKNTLIGIVSAGTGCGRRDLPGIYTNIANPEIRKFILQNAL